MARAKTFDEKQTLLQIQEVFWAKGFHETSLRDLTAKTGLAKMSLYNCYGSKEEMFSKALTAYFENSKAERSDKDRGLQFLFARFESFTDEAKSGKAKMGCFVMNSALELSESKGLKSKIARKCWIHVENTFFEALEQAVEDKEIEKGADVDALSKWLVSQVFVIRQFSKFIKDSKYFDELKSKVFDVLNEVKIKKTTND